MQKWLAHRDLDSLRAFVVDGYRVRDLAGFARNAAETLPGIVPAEIAASLEVNRQIPRFTWLAVPPDTLPAARIPERLMDDLPITAHRMRTGEGRALKISDFLDRAQLHRLPLYAELFRSLGIEHAIGISLSISSVSSIGLALYRAKRDFSERDRLVLDLLRPHLVQMHDAARAVTAASHEPVPAAHGHAANHETIEIDAADAVRRMTARAREWLVEYFGVRLPALSLPESLWLWIRQQEDALRGVAHALPVPRVPLAIEGKDGRLIVTLLSDGAAGRVLVLERVSSAVQPSSLEGRFALTRREAEVLAWVAQGKSNSEVARIVEAQPRTIEKHLERVYRKLGVENRVAAILAIAGQTIAQLMS